MTIAKTHQAHRGFTLIELMAVITIMVILGAISVGGMAFVNEIRNQKKAEIDIALLSNAIEKYKLDMGDYPGSDEDSQIDGDISEELYNALFYEGYVFIEDRASWVEGESNEIYVVDMDPRNSKQSLVEQTTASTPSMDLKIKDPWGRSYRYRKGINAENPDFDLWSTGKDGESNESDPSRDIEVNRDDVRNF